MLFLNFSAKFGLVNNLGRKFVFFPMEMYAGNIGGKSAFETIFFTQIKFEKNDLRVVGILWGSKLLALLLLLLLPFFSFVTLFALNASQRASTAKGKKRSLE